MDDTISDLLSHDELKAIVYPMEMDDAFVQESLEHLDNLEQVFLDLETNLEKQDLYNDIFRALHSLNGLEVKSGGRHYYLPLDYIIETVKISPAMIRSHKKMQMAVIRGELLPVFNLQSLLGNEKSIEGLLQSESPNSDHELSLVVLNINGKKAALCVDCFYTESEYVIKPLKVTGALSKISGIAGATITPSGKVIFILDPLKLL